MKKFVVGLPNKKTEMVEAGYVTIDNGHLIFRKGCSGSYPDTIKAFAPGHWATCTLDKKEATQ